MSSLKRTGLLSNEQSFAAAVFGGSIVMTTLGTNYCLGGLAPYIVSRLRASGGARNGTESGWEYLNTGAVVWVFVVAALFQGIGMLASGFLVINLPCDRRWSILAGCLLSSLGTCLSGVTVGVSLGLVILTSGAIFGLGQGLAYALIIDSVTSWTDNRKGLITGVLVSCFAAGAIVFLPIQSKIINPDNLTPGWRVGSDRLFHQPEVTNRVANSYFIMSAVYAVIQVAFTGLIKRRRHRSDNGTASNGETNEATMLIAVSDGLVSDKPSPTDEDPKTPLSSPESQSTTIPGITRWTLKEAVASLPFVVMGVSIFFLTPASIVLPSLDKAYGEKFISNDMLLSVLAGVGSVFNAIGRLVAGAVIDRVHFRVCVLTQSLLLAGLHAVTPLSTVTHPALFFLLVCLVNFVFAGVFVFFPWAVENLYGSALFPQVYGLVYLFKAVSGALIAVVTTTCLGWFGWTGVMLLVAATSLIGGLVILLYNTDRWRLAVALS